MQRSGACLGRRESSHAPMVDAIGCLVVDVGWCSAVDCNRVQSLTLCVALIDPLIKEGPRASLVAICQTECDQCCKTDQRDKMQFSPVTQQLTHIMCRYVTVSGSIN